MNYNLKLIERFDDDLSTWTLDQSGGTVSIQTLDSDNKLQFNDTNGSALVSAKKSYTEPTEAYLVEFDFYHASGAVGVMELLDSGNNPIITIDVGSIVDTLSFDTDNDILSTRSFPNSEYNRVIVYVDPAGNIARAFMSLGHDLGSPPNQELAQIGGNKSYSGVAITQISFRTATVSTGEVRIDEIKIYTADLFLYGNSRAEGFNEWTTDPERRANSAPDFNNSEGTVNTYLARLLGGNIGWVANRGMGGSQTAHQDSLFADEIGSHGAKRLIFMGGFNDIHRGITLATMQINTNSIITKAQTASITGLELILCNIFPGSLINTAAEKQVLDDFNTWIEGRATAEGTVFVNLRTIMQDPLDAYALNPDYDEGDGIHCNNLGNHVIAKAIYDALIDYSAETANNILHPLTSTNNVLYPLGWFVESDGSSPSLSPSASPSPMSSRDFDSSILVSPTLDGLISVSATLDSYV